MAIVDRAVVGVARKITAKERAARLDIEDNSFGNQPIDIKSPRNLRSQDTTKKKASDPLVDLGLIDYPSEGEDNFFPTVKNPIPAVLNVQKSKEMKSDIDLDSKANNRHHATQSRGSSAIRKSSPKKTAREKAQKKTMLARRIQAAKAKA
jgi:hypothetical protein